MKIWLIQRSEITPIDKGNNRLLRTASIAENIINAGHEVIFWTSDFNHFDHDYRFKKSKLVKYKQNYQIQFLKSIGYTKNFSIRRYIDDMYVANSFTKLAFKKDLPDIILVSMPSIEITSSVIEYARRNKVPVYVEIRDLWPDIFLDVTPLPFKPFVFFLNFFFDYKLKKSLKNADGVIGITETYLNWALKKINRRKSQKDTVIQMGYKKNKSNDHLDAIQMKTIIKKFSFLSNFQLVTTVVGTLGKTNDLETILEAAKVLNIKNMSIVLVIAGKGESYCKLIKKYSYLENVYFVGWLNADEIKFLLSKSHLGYLPYINSKNYKFNIPNKPSEYLSEGLHLALSLKEGEMFNLIHKNKIGFSYRNDSQILVNKLEEFYMNKSKFNEYKLKSLSVFNKYFDADKVYMKLTNFLIDQKNNE